MKKIKIIISIWLLPFLFSLNSINATIRVSLLAFSSDGHELDQAEVSRSFFLEVSVEGAGGNVSDPQIEAVDGLNIQRVGHEMHIINSRSTIKYKYKATINKQGSYEIGPAVINDGNKTSRSGVLTINVGKEEKACDVDSGQKDKKMFVRLSANKLKIVVGQKIEGKVTFYSPRSDVTLRGLVSAPIEGMAFDQGGAKQSVQIVDGKQYISVSWKWQYIPKKPGFVVIPAQAVQVIDSEGNDFYSNFSSFFHLAGNEKKLVSNALGIQINPLPNFSGTVDAVGNFRNFTAVVNQGAAREGDGIVLTLAVEGDTNLDSLDIALRNVPSVFKSYSSKQAIKKITNNDTIKKKSFEFVIQGMEAGEWEIPKQTFTYYDVKALGYKTLETAPIMVKILRQSTTKRYTPPPPVDDVLSTAVDSDIDCDNAMLILNTYGSWREIPERKIPWWLFIILFLAPIGLLVSKFFAQMFRRYSTWNAPKAEWKKAFKLARVQIRSAKKKGDFTALYRTFIKLFSTRLSVPQSKVSEKMIMKVLRSGGFSDDQLKEWDSFFASLSVFVFYAAKGSDEDKVLFDQANAWIGVLEEII